MRTHPLNCLIALPDRLDDLCLVKDRYSDIFFQAAGREYSGVIYKSDALIALANKFDYTALGYDLLRENDDRLQRSASAMYGAGRIWDISQMDHDFSHEPIIKKTLDDDLRNFKPVWSDIFNAFSQIVEPLLGDYFEIRLTPLCEDEEYFHYDPNMVLGILPLGHDSLSTVCAGEDSDVIRPTGGELVLVTPTLKHSSPASDKPRLCLVAAKYDYQF